MTEEEAFERAKKINLFERATTSIVAFSNGSFILDGDLQVLKDQADKEGLSFYILKGELPQVKKSKDATSGTEI